MELFFLEYMLTFKLWVDWIVKKWIKVMDKEPSFLYIYCKINILQEQQRVAGPKTGNNNFMSFCKKKIWDSWSTNNGWSTKQCY